jgi:uncharacterized protein involved in exopolysaccharide biosynthesis
MTLASTGPTTDLALRLAARPPNRAMVVGASLVVTAVTLLAVVAAYLVADLGPRRYEARSAIGYQGEAWVETVAVTARSPDLLRPISERRGIPLTELEEDLAVAQVPDTQVIELRYRHTDPEVALAVVGELTSAVVAVVPAPGFDEVQALLDARRSELVTQIDAARAAVEAAGRGSELDLALEEMADLKGQLRAVDQLRVQNQVRLVERPHAVSVVTSPYVAHDAVEPRPWRSAMFGLVAGASVAGVVALYLLRRTA